MSIYIKDIFQKYIKISQYKKKEKVVPDGEHIKLLYFSLTIKTQRWKPECGMRRYGCLDRRQRAFSGDFLSVFAWFQT